jgi:hypothetical protein
MAGMKRLSRDAGKDEMQRNIAEIKVIRWEGEIPLRLFVKNPKMCGLPVR